MRCNLANLIMIELNMNSSTLVLNILLPFYLNEHWLWGVINLNYLIKTTHYKRIIILNIKFQTCMCPIKSTNNFKNDFDKLGNIQFKIIRGHTLSKTSLNPTKNLHCINSNFSKQSCYVLLT